MVPGFLEVSEKSEASAAIEAFSIEPIRACTFGSRSPAAAFADFSSLARMATSNSSSVCSVEEALSSKA